MNAEPEIKYGGKSVFYTMDQLRSIKAMKEESPGSVWAVARKFASGWIDGVSPKTIDELCAWLAVADHVDLWIKDLEVSKSQEGKMDYVVRL